MLIFRKGIESEKVGENGYPAPKSDPKYFTPRVETRRFDYDRYNKVFDKGIITNCHLHKPFWNQKSTGTKPGMVIIFFINT